MKTPVIKTRLTTSSDTTVDVDPYLHDTELSEDQKVLCLKTMIMRELLEHRIADSNIPTILNYISDKNYIRVIVKKELMQETSIKVLANAISAMCGMYGIDGITMHLMVDIIHKSLK